MADGFFGKGQDRRAWLDSKADGLTHFVPPELRKWFEIADMVNPVSEIGRAGQASDRMFTPETDGWGRVEAAGDMLSSMAGVAAPAAVAKAGGMTAAQALQEAMLSASAGPRAAGGMFAADEAGGLALPGLRSQADEIADMLASGRAGDVTDDMMAQADPQELWRLYESGATGADMPMDAASRMARAEGMGFDTGTPLYHGTKSDFQAFDRSQVIPHNARGAGFYMTDSPSSSSAYSAGEGVMRMDVRKGESPNVMPVTARGNILDENAVLSQAEVDAINPDLGAGYFDKAYPAKGGNVMQETSYRPDEANAAIRQAGYAGRRGGGIVDGVDTVVFDPASIRSRFARFDPRLKHLANLSAGVGGMAYMGGEDERKAQIRAWLETQQ